jgi:uncharacterized protein (TIGR02391 family)
MDEIDMASQYEMKFDPRTIEHLGVRMYSTLPPALAELISNAYDADASRVELKFHEHNGKPISIQVMDSGHGMSADDIQNKFLVIGRNRRKEDGDKRTTKFERLPTGKKGLGKLALFGLSKVITVDTICNGLRNRFVLNWDELMNAEGSYNPRAELLDEPVDKPNGTIIKLSELKRQSPFDIAGLADSLSKIFIVDDGFEIILTGSDGISVVVDNARRYSNFTKEFEWDLEALVPKESKFFGKVKGLFYTASTPIKPNSGLRGVSLFSRGKLVNMPEFFSNSTSSHFFQYLTGWIQADFIDLLPEDVISTNRQSINWDNDEMREFRFFLSEMISKVNASWREQRKKKKDKDFEEATGIDTDFWMSTMPDDVKEHTSDILNMLGAEDALEKFTPIIKALHKIVPEYPQLHWRYLNDNLRERVRAYYQNRQYGQAADQAVKIYLEHIRTLTGRTEDANDLVGRAFTNNPCLHVSDITTATGKNLQEGQQAMSRGLVSGFRNPMNHAPIDSVVPSIFSDVDCLNILSLTSYLMGKVDKARLIKD